jgi:putative ABC transport system permease protein
MRTGLTMLGIVISVSTVIAVVAIGEGAAQEISHQFAVMGTNILMIIHSDPRPGSQAANRPLTLDDAQAIVNKCPDTVSAVSEVVDGSVPVKLGNKAWTTHVQGVSAQHPQVAKWEMDEGRFFTDEENTERARVAVLGRSTIGFLTGDRTANVVGQHFLLNQTRFTVIGILQEKGAGAFGEDQDDVVMIPINTALRRVYNRTSLDEISVGCRTTGDMELATEEIGALLREGHKLRPPYPDNDDFQIFSQSEVLRIFDQIGVIMTSLLAGIALISLFVGGIGIMNIMLVSVTERTREIGIRRTVGATGHDIRTQFLIEAMVISLAGGCVGILLGFALGYGASVLLKVPAIVHPAVVLLAVTVSGAVGLFFGLYPAHRAASLNPIDALRFE